MNAFGDHLAVIFKEITLDIGHYKMFTDSRRPLGFGFIRVWTKEALKKALELDGIEYLGRTLKIEQEI